MGRMHMVARKMNRPVTRMLVSAVMLSIALPMMAAGPDRDRKPRSWDGDRDDRRGSSFPHRDRDRDDDDKRRGGHSHINTQFGIKIVIGDDDWRGGKRFPAPHPHDDCLPAEEAPCELRFQAFQAGDQVIVIATGANRGSGYRTYWKACDVGDRTPELVLVNSPTSRCDDRMDRFEVRGSFCTSRRVHEVEVKVAGQCHRVSVCQIDRIG